MSQIIIQNCNQCNLDIPLKEAQQLYKKYQIRHPNAFFLRSKIKDWDGMVKFITKSGTFKIGLLPSILASCKELGINPKIVDLRKPVPIVSKPVTAIGKYKLRPEQITAVSSVINNRVGGKPFHIGVLDYTVNAGKSLIMAAIYYSFKEKLKTLLITNDSDWLQQSKEEFKQYLPGEDITFVQGGNVKNWANFSIGMVQSLSRNLKKYQPELAKIDMVLVDEADLAGNKSYQQVLTHLYNTRVRIGLSGTIYMSKYAKDRLKIMNLRSFFGDTLSEFRLSDSIKKGYSTKTIVKMVPAEPYYPKNWGSEKTDYKAIYDDTITNNRWAYEVVLDRLRYNMQYGRLPALVVCKYVQHCENIYKHLKATLEGNLNIAYVHVNTADKARKKIMEDFRNGKIDILVSTTLIARGKNFPLLKLLINAASMDSQEKSIQFLGRLVRTHKSKSRVYLDDIQYFGDYLTRHGNHRRMYYQREKLKVIQLGKQWKKHPKHRPHPY